MIGMRPSQRPSAAAWSLLETSVSAEPMELISSRCRLLFRGVAMLLSWRMLVRLQSIIQTAIHLTENLDCSDEYCCILLVSRDYTNSNFKNKQYKIVEGRTQSEEARRGRAREATV